MILDQGNDFYFIPLLPRWLGRGEGLFQGADADQHALHGFAVRSPYGPQAKHLHNPFFHRAGEPVVAFPGFLAQLEDLHGGFAGGHGFILARANAPATIYRTLFALSASRKSRKSAGRCVTTSFYTVTPS